MKARPVKPPEKFSWVDLLLLAGLAAFIYGLLALASQWTAELSPTVDISLSPYALVKYSFFSVSRGFIAYGISLAFSLVYGYTAAYSPRAERLMIPLLDILQSLPVLSFLPGLVLGMITLFPLSNVGLELACVLMIFTGQAWNMTFSFYHSLKSIPQELKDAARIYRFNRWERFLKLELPYSAIGLIWNSMMSMAGGWFFLTVTEAFVLGNKDFRLPGVGAYMSVAIAQKNIPAICYAVLAMIITIITVDQLLWRPAVAWAQRFKMEEVEIESDSEPFFLEFLKKSHLAGLFGEKIVRPLQEMFLKLAGRSEAANFGAITEQRRRRRWVRNLLLGLGGAVLFYLLGEYLLLISKLKSGWWLLCKHAFYSGARVFMALIIGSAWAIPAGVTIGTNRKLARIFQPIIQITASFPAPMVFPLVMWGVLTLGIWTECGVTLLMLLGTQWYILFNVIAGASSIPQDLKDVASAYQIGSWRRWKALILPAIFPSLVTGWTTAAGGAWNASIVAEYVQSGSNLTVVPGLGTAATSRCWPPAS